MRKTCILILVLILSAASIVVAFPNAKADTYEITTKLTTGVGPIPFLLDKEVTVNGIITPDVAGSGYQYSNIRIRVAEPHTSQLVLGPLSTTHLFSGTFTPDQVGTYEVWATFPGQTVTVGGNTYIASSSESTHFQFTIAPVDFSISASPTSQTINQGQSTTYTVTMASLGGWSNQVFLSVTGLPTGATGTFSPSTVTPTGTSTLTVTTTSQTPVGTSTLTITGDAPLIITHSTTVTLVVNSAAPPPPTPDFTVSAIPASQTVNQGQSTTYTANVGSVGGFTGGVSLTVMGLPTGATGSFNPMTLNPTVTGASTLTVTTTSQTPAGTYTLTITGNWGVITHSTTVTLVVNSAAPPPPTPDFTVSASPASGTVGQGQSTTYTVTIGSVGGFSTSVSLTVTGLPTGATGTFSPSTVTPTGTSTLTVTTTSQTPAGTTTLTITGTAGILTHSTTVTLVVSAVSPPPPSPDFTVSASPTSGTVSQGQATSYTITVSSVGGFSTGVSLSVTGLPAGATGSFSPSTVSPTGTSTLTVVTTSQTPTGTATLTITGTSGVSHQTTVALVVSSTPPPSTLPPSDFAVSASPASGTVSQGQPATFTVAVASLSGFNQEVSFSVAGLPTGATASFSPSTVTSTGTSTLTVATTGSTPSGTYHLTITGTGAGLTHQATVDLIVSVAPDFGVSASPVSQSVSQGQSASYTVTVTFVGGFGQGVSLSVTGLPAGAIPSFSQSSIASSGTSTLTVATNIVTPGTYQLTITGTGGALTHQTNATLVIFSSTFVSSTFVSSTFDSLAFGLWCFGFLV